MSRQDTTHTTETVNRTNRASRASPEVIEANPRLNPDYYRTEEEDEEPVSEASGYDGVSKAIGDEAEEVSKAMTGAESAEDVGEVPIEDALEDWAAATYDPDREEVRKDAGETLEPLEPFTREELEAAVSTTRKNATAADAEALRNVEEALADLPEEVAERVREALRDAEEAEDEGEEDVLDHLERNYEEVLADLDALISEGAATEKAEDAGETEPETVTRSMDGLPSGWDRDTFVEALHEA